ncbi:amidase [Anaeromyxobacter oryzae]|uniref:Amidase n=1 Tax=Anaeromyxobacter oryzae TaxID=2918170 RepID=A0ABM7WRM1_9BACT|nr:amidase [Anaeromyxobacter oryzae]BDG02109.1 amidase [Anaeromyxobacter oryzae]
MRLPEYDRLDALALAERIRRGELTAADALEAAIERADARNPRLNAIVARYDDEARTRAKGPLPPGPLSGVPFLIKDLYTEWSGHPLTGSTRLSARRVAARDSDVVTRLLRAGVVLFGQTNTPELGVMAITESAFRGPARNPWNPAFTPGGSSGGSAAAVAARVVPAAHGNDGGGSLRIPASACGLFAMKPTRGRISMGPGAGEAMSGLATEGVLTRSVRDSAALLDLLAGGAPGDPYAAPARARPFVDEVGAAPGRLRVAYMRRSLFARETHPEATAAVEGAARLLAELGHDVIEVAPIIPRDALVHAYLVVLAAQVAVDVANAARIAGRKRRPDDLEPETAALDAAGRVLSAADLVQAEEEMHRAGRTMAAFLAAHDVLVTATTAQPALRIGQLAARAHERLAMRAVARVPSRTVLEKLFAAVGSRSFEATGNTMLFNQTGQPAMSVPLHVTAAGLPLGVQVAGRFGDEATLFRLAAQLEAARPWAERLPPGL